MLQNCRLSEVQLNLFIMNSSVQPKEFVKSESVINGFNFISFERQLNDDKSFSYLYLKIVENFVSNLYEI
jgi:hypothetical protein